MAQFVARFAVNQFNKEFSMPSKNSEFQKQILENLSILNNIYRPKRCYRSKNSSSDDKLTRVQITLLEYGQRGMVKNIIRNNSEEDNLEQEQTIEVLLKKLITVVKKAYKNILTKNQCYICMDIFNECFFVLFCCV